MCTFFVVVISTFCLQIWHVWIARETKKKNFNKSFLWIGTYSTVCLLSSSVWNFNNHTFVSKLTQMTSNQCKIQLVVQLRLFCWIICNNFEFRSNIKLCLFCNGFVFLFQTSIIPVYGCMFLVFGYIYKIVQNCIYFVW